MNIREINIDKYPIILFSDSHLNLVNIKKLQELYPKSLIISLGDFTSLWDTKNEFNFKAIQYFINGNIQVCRGNHESYLVSLSDNNTSELSRVLSKSYQNNLSEPHINYLKSLPIGFKLIRPDGYYYLCYHNFPGDLWAFKESLTKEEFKGIYQFDDKCIAVTSGHLHLNLSVSYPNLLTKRIVIGNLCNIKDKKSQNYLLIEENDIKFKNLNYT